MEETFRTLKFVSEIGNSKVMDGFCSQSAKNMTSNQAVKRIETLESEISYLKKMLNLKRGASSTNDILLQMRLLEKENHYLKKNFISK